MNRSVLTEESDSVHIAADVEEVLRRLLDRVQEDADEAGGAGGPGAGEGAEHGETLLSVRFNGVTYRLLREAPPGNHDQASVALSPREREIVRLVAKGLPNKAIAEVLDVSLWTVATHLRRVFAKLAVNSRAEMVARALEAGLLRRAE